MAKKKAGSKSSAPKAAPASGGFPSQTGNSGVDFLTGSQPLGDKLFNFGARIINTGEFIMPRSQFNQKLMQETGRRAPLLQPLPINHDHDVIQARNEEGYEAAAAISGGPTMQRNTRWQY
jgi:hypothetical protein